MTTPPEPDPNWSFSPDHDIRCPECDTHLHGLNWVLNDDETETVGMSLVPCGHELPTVQWELKFSGRDTGERRYGQTIRIPAFIRKVQ
jgi:hypothetical protein